MAAAPSAPAKTAEPQGAASWLRMLSLYAVWLLFGLVGGHHVLLGRYEQAVLYGQSLGLFGVGWAADFFLLPHYQSRVDGRGADGPCGRGGCVVWLLRFLLGRVRGLVGLGLSLTYAALLESTWVYPYTGPTSGSDTAATREIEDVKVRVLAYAGMSAAAAAGAVLVANVGSSSSRFLWAFAGALVPLLVTDAGEPAPVGGSATPFSGTGTEDPSSEPLPAALLAALGATLVSGLVSRDGAEKTQRRPRASAARRCCRCCGVSLAVLLFWLSLPVVMVLHGEIRVNPRTGKYDPVGLGTTYLGPYALRNGKDVWEEAARVWEELKKYRNARGWEGMKTDFFDYVGDSDEYAVLGLTKGEATLDDVKRAYRSKVRKLHPDRLPKDMPEEKVKEATDEFYKVTKAYDTLCHALGGKQGCSGRGSDSSGGGDADAGDEPATPPPPPPKSPPSSSRASRGARDGGDAGRQQKAQQTQPSSPPPPPKQRQKATPTPTPAPAGKVGGRAGASQPKGKGTPGGAGRPPAKGARGRQQDEDDEL